MRTSAHYQYNHFIVQAQKTLAAKKKIAEYFGPQFWDVQIAKQHVLHIQEDKLLRTKSRA